MIKKLIESKALDLVRDFLDCIGEDSNREGLRETPYRVVKSWGELFSGYGVDPVSIMKTFKEGTCNEMVALQNIEFYSTCEHHILPFFGYISIGYIPNGKVLGVSKLVRLVEVFSRRLQIQERMTTQIADLLMKGINPLGVIVVCKAKHLCMIARGVQKRNPIMITSAVRGVFYNDNSAREEFLKLIEQEKIML